MASQIELPRSKPAGASRPSVCLITPPSSFLLDERVFVSLGILKVAASLEDKGYDVNLLDLSGIENYVAALSHYIAGSRDVAVGITSTTPQLPAVVKIAKAIREIRPDLKLIIGGPHVTLVYSALALERKRGIVGGRAHRAAEAGDFLKYVRRISTALAAAARRHPRGGDVEIGRAHV